MSGWPQQPPEGHRGDSLKVSSDGRAGGTVQRVAVPGCLQFVQEVVQRWDAFLQAFALAGLGYHLAGTAAVVKGVPRQDLPVVKHTLGEGLATSVGSKVGGEAYTEDRRLIKWPSPRGVFPVLA